MSRKILCYDLHGANRDDYQEVYDYIENDLDGTRATESVFIFFSNRSNKELKKEFVSRFGKDVSVLVNDFPQGASFSGISDNEKWVGKD